MPTVDELGVVPGDLTVWPSVAPDNAVFGADPVVHLARAQASNADPKGYRLFAICQRVGGPKMALEHAPQPSRLRFWRRAKWCEHCERYRDHVAAAARDSGAV